MLGVPIVRVMDAELPAASVITSVFAPVDAVTGMLNVAVVVPAAMVCEPEAKVMAWPPRVAVKSLVAAKPVPDTVTGVPFSMPVVVDVIFGTTVIVWLDDRAGAANVSVTVFEPATLPVGTTKGMP